jgi:hypothetical protein
LDRAANLLRFLLRTGKKPDLFLDRAEQPEVLRAAGYSDVDLLRDEGGMALYAARGDDDHLRNHGFLLEDAGWSLAPAYDMNPTAHGEGLVLNISETDNSQDLGLVRNVAKHFRVKPRRAEEIIGEVIKVVSTWRKQATKAKLSRVDQDRMASAFRLVSMS